MPVPRVLRSCHAPTRAVKLTRKAICDSLTPMLRAKPEKIAPAAVALGP